MFKYLSCTHVLEHHNVLALPTFIYRQKVSRDLEHRWKTSCLGPWSDARVGSSLVFTRTHLDLTVTTRPVFPAVHHRVAVRHVKVKPRSAALTMLKRLDKIRFRGPRTRDEFPDLGESPPASDGECNDDLQPKPRSAAARDMEEVLRDPVSTKPLYVSFLSLPRAYWFCSCPLPEKTPDLSSTLHHFLFTHSKQGGKRV